MNPQHNTTQPIELSDMSRKLWKAARRVTELEYEIQLLKRQRRELSNLVQSLMDSEERLDRQCN